MSAQLEADYDVMAGIDRSMPAIVAEWMAASRAAISAAPSRHTIAYGGKPGLTYDAFFPAGRPHGALIFLHGGFWVQGSKDAVAFAAPSFTSAGIIYIAVTYGLAPAYSLDALIGNVEAAARSIAAEAAGWDLDPRRIVVGGHSAGAYLAAALAISPRRAFDPLATLLISGLFDLGAVGGLTKMRALGLSDADRRRLSIRGQALAGPVLVAVGANEPAGFQAQSRDFHTALSARGNALPMFVAPSDDHFSIARRLGDADAELAQRVRALFK